MSLCSVVIVDEESNTGDGGGSERNSSWSRIEDGGVGGQVENQFCMVGMSGQDEVSCFSTEESETVDEEERVEEGMLSVSDACEVADSRLGRTRGVAGRGSTRPKPASPCSESCSASISLRMS